MKVTFSIGCTANDLTFDDKNMSELSAEETNIMLDKLLLKIERGISKKTITIQEILDLFQEELELDIELGMELGMELELDMDMDMDMDMDSIKNILPKLKTEILENTIGVESVLELFEPDEDYYDDTSCEQCGDTYTEKTWII